MRKLNNQLPRKVTRQLEDLILNQETQILKKRWGKKDFADFATEKLGVPITIHNVTGAAATVDVKFPNVHNKKKGNPHNLKSLNKHERLINEICMYLLDVPCSSGSPLPKEIKEIGEAYLDRLTRGYQDVG